MGSNGLQWGKMENELCVFTFFLFVCFFFFSGGCVAMANGKAVTCVSSVYIHIHMRMRWIGTSGQGVGPAGRKLMEKYGHTRKSMYGF